MQRRLLLVMMQVNISLFSFQCKHLLLTSRIKITYQTSLNVNQYLAAAVSDWTITASVGRARSNTHSISTRTQLHVVDVQNSNSCFSSQGFCDLIGFLLPAQLETLPGNLCAQKFQSLFLVVCVMCIQGQTEAPHCGRWRGGGVGWIFCWEILKSLAVVFRPRCKI